MPFTVEQFVAVFANYNAAIWPVQIAVYVLGAIAFTLAFRGSARTDRAIAAILSVMWAFTGIGYHLTFFAAINKAAYGFGTLFLIEAAALTYTGAYRGRLNFGFRGDAAAWVGVFFAIYAAILYPLIGIATGHLYPELPMFGVTPCPVTIFTLGMLLLTVRPPSGYLLAIPLLWSLIGGSAAILLQIPQDWLLLASGAVTALLLLVRGSDPVAEAGPRA
ncbi:DUF6064 family protein [Bradyrhizobium sp.]|uniref:DUF6064 family protein n=1 Tax=Bradyrhizobium sp. TaxID=376 RepID=UPI0025C6902B|nr:DUF6064 family protein [Bradyrhizobium sp.]